MDRIPPYDFFAYVSAARVAVSVCSSFEFLLLICGSLKDSNMFAKILYFVFLGASIAVSAHNVFLNIDGRDEIRKALTSREVDVRGRSAALVLSPALAGVFMFLSLSGHALFSLFVLIHVLASVGQLAIEAYEVSNKTECASGTPPLLSPIVAE